MKLTNIALVAGDFFRIETVLTRPDPNNSKVQIGVDMTGGKLVFVLDTDTQLVKESTTFLDAVEGRGVVELEEEDTKNIPHGIYKYIIRAVSLSGRTYTVCRGDCEIINPLYILND